MALPAVNPDLALCPCGAKLSPLVARVLTAKCPETDFASIIALLNVATMPDPAIDRAIAKVCGIDWSSDEEGNFGGYDIMPRRVAFTSSIDAALLLIPTGCYWLIGAGKTREPEPLYGAQVRAGDIGNDTILGEGEHDRSAAFALCIASLKARVKIGR